MCAAGLAAALAQEDNVRLSLGALPPRELAFRVSYFTIGGEPDSHAAPVTAAAGTFADVAEPPHRITIWHSIEEGHPLGNRLVVADEPIDDVRIAVGRLPGACTARRCEVLELAGHEPVGARVRLGASLTAIVVGRGAISPELAPDPSELGDRALLVRAIASSLRPLVAGVGTTVVTTALLDPRRIHGFTVQRVRARLRDGVVRLERGEPLVRATAPIGTLGALAHRGTVARRRLLLVGGEGGALVIAFAAFVASGRRRDIDLVDEQLTTLGASRPQVALARSTETFIPALLGTVVAVVAITIAAGAFAVSRDLPAAFVGGALPARTILIAVAFGVAAAVLLTLAPTPRRVTRLGVGPLELAAVAALVVVVWQTWTTGALDPEQLAASGGGPLLFLVPALSFFATAVVLLRFVPVALQGAERMFRRGPFTLRLSFLTASRRSQQAAAATTFLAVALGTALFSLDYRETLARQAHDEAAFATGAESRIIGRPRGDGHDVTPTTRFRRVTDERPTLVARLAGDIVEADPPDGRLPVQILGLPAERLPSIVGWRSDFSRLPLAALAQRLRPHPVDLRGPPLAGDARALRAWARAKTDVPRIVFLHFLLPGQSFAHVRVGVADTRWRLLQVPLPRRLRNAQLIGAEFTPTYVPNAYKYDPQGYLALGRIEQQRRDGRWTSLPSLERWTETTTTNGRRGILNGWRFRDAPVTRGIRFDFNGTFLPSIHPKIGLPDPPLGFEVGAVPALVGPAVAGQAVDGRVTLDVAGHQLPIRVVATAKLFPTVTSHERQFVVLDYATLFAALNANRPGTVAPSEAWFFLPKPHAFAERFGRPPFAGERSLGVGRVEARLLADPLASASRTTLTIAAIVAGALALIGLALAARFALAADRAVLVEYEALGVAPSSLRRAVQLELLALSAFGVIAGIVGGFLSLRLISAFVAVNGSARRPLPPIVPTVAWSAVSLTLVLVACGAAIAVVAITGRSFSEPAARRLRA